MSVLEQIERRVTSLQRIIRGPAPETQEGYEKAILSKSKPDPKALEHRKLEDVAEDEKVRDERIRCAAVLADNSPNVELIEAQKRHEAAREAVENHPLAKLQRDWEAAQDELHGAVANLRAVRDSSGDGKNMARNYLWKTASPDIERRASEVRNEINRWTQNRHKLALRSSEREKRAQCEQLVATLPAVAKTSADAASVNLQLEAAKAALARFAERERDMATCDKEIAKLEKKVQAIFAEREDPARMKFKSQAQNRD